MNPFCGSHFSSICNGVCTVANSNFACRSVHGCTRGVGLSFFDIPSIGGIRLINIRPRGVFIRVRATGLTRLKLSVGDVTDAVGTRASIGTDNVVRTSATGSCLHVANDPSDIRGVTTVPVGTGKHIFHLNSVTAVAHNCTSPPRAVVCCGNGPTINVTLSVRSNNSGVGLNRGLTGRVTHVRGRLPLKLRLGRITGRPRMMGGSVDRFSRDLCRTVVVILMIDLVALKHHDNCMVSYYVPLVLLNSFYTVFTLNVSLRGMSLNTLIISLNVLISSTVIIIRLVRMGVSRNVPHGRTTSCTFGAYT